MVAHLLLLLAEQPRHGYELAESLRTWEFEGVTTSTVYRELAKLEEDGLVLSFWQSSQARGPARHMYELTDMGRGELVACGDDVRDLMGHLAEFLARCNVVDTQPRSPTDTAAKPDPARAPHLAAGLSRFWRSR